MLRESCFTIKLLVPLQVEEHRLTQPAGVTPVE
jgi:hypothetical protein